ncbi:MAG: glycosyltransferase family 4 protein, partial [Acidimicrobiia bacterium]|nr:glycosyltransferase family 4 protein [Acidimicrobiia bacterium]
VDYIEAAGVRHVPLTASTRGMNPLADLKSAWQLWRILRNERPDVLHTHNPKPGVYGRILGRLSGVPVVVNTVHGLYATEDDPMLKRSVVYGLEAIASRFSDAELVQSSEDLELLTRLHIVAEAKGSYLGNGVDLDRFHPDTVGDEARRTLRKEFDVDDDQIVVGIVGRLVAEKGYPELFEAFELLDDRFVLVCVGPDEPDKSDALPRAMIDAATRRGVRFLGMRTDVERLYRAFDLFALPSHREGFPRSAMEASAMGLPVIATDIRGCREVVIDGENGVLVPVRSARDIAAAIRRVGGDPETMRAMSQAGRERSKSHFDERTVVDTVMRSYADVARRKGLDLFPPGAEPVSYRAAVASDAPTLARLHMNGIHEGFLPKLGHRFMTRLYRAMVEWDGSVIQVAVDSTGPVGFVAGTTSTGAFYKHFIKTHGLTAGVVAAPSLVRNLGRAIETLRYDGGGVDVAAELLSMAVAGPLRGRGIGRRLGADFLDGMRAKDVEAVKVVVASHNAGAIAAYRSMGFVDHANIEVHEGESSEVLVWSI